MKNYALLHDNGVCHSISQTSGGRDDTESNNVIEIEEYDPNLLGNRWTGTEWDYRPTYLSTWNGESWVLDERELRELEYAKGPWWKRLLKRIF